ncbi:hypothetical protein RUM43_004487 [Polyplax serrata]|uniref:Uncharacterized protein n=1 Tax=Polyplax serrata TaxID=468196 RepID=A0AAN8XLJ6_POLSC
MSSTFHSGQTANWPPDDVTAMLPRHRWTYNDDIAVFFVIKMLGEGKGASFPSEQGLGGFYR